MKVSKVYVSEHGAADVVKISRCCGVYTSNQLLWSSLLYIHHSSQQEQQYVLNRRPTISGRYSYGLTAPTALMWVRVCVFLKELLTVLIYTHERSLQQHTFWPLFTWYLQIYYNYTTLLLWWIWLNLKELPFKGLLFTPPTRQPASLIPASWRGLLPSERLQFIE